MEIAGNYFLPSGTEKALRIMKIMKTTKKVTSALLIATYNWPEALELLLESALKQRVMPDEILIADDGSTEATRQVIASYIPRFPIPVHHVWHEDKGFRKSMILNKALATTDAEYIIQIDGDCMMHPEFIADHLSCIKEGLYVYGTRVRIKESNVERVLKEKKIRFHFFSRGIKKRPRGLRIPFLSALFGVRERISPRFRGCNVSFWRADLIAVNGYNEAMEGWGSEDFEMVIRLHHYGIKGRRLKFKGILYHLDHPESSKFNAEHNFALQQKALAGKYRTVAKGIAQYLKK